MTGEISNDPLERLLAQLEKEILAAPDSDVLAGEAQRLAAAEARSLVAAALAERARRMPRRGPRPLPGLVSDGRATVRQLLVASPRARDIAGPTQVDALSDAQVEAILARFVDAGLLTPDTGKD